MLVLTAVTSTVVQRFAPKARQAIHEPRRLDWEAHVEDVRRRKLFRRMYRMEEHSFYKLAELLRPILERNDYYASKKDPQRVRPRVRMRQQGYVTLGLPCRLESIRWCVLVSPDSCPQDEFRTARDSSAADDVDGMCAVVPTAMRLTRRSPATSHSAWAAILHFLLVL